MKATILTSLLCILAQYAFSQMTDNEKKDQLIADWERAKAFTLEYVEAMPDDKFDFKPTPDMRSFAEQCLHIAQGNVNLVSNGTGAPKIFEGVNLEKDESLKSKAVIIQKLNESYDFVLTAIKDNTIAFNEIVERGPFKVTRIGWINKGFEHQTHHRGQCAVYLRLSGVTPPQARLF